MTGGAALVDTLLEDEARAWRDLPPADYERAICAMMNDAAARPVARQEPAPLLELAARTLERSGPTLADSRACAAENILALLDDTIAPQTADRIRDLYLEAWRQLCLSAQTNPEPASLSPDLPPGVLLPYGADPAAIEDPVLREQAEEAVALHKEALERWSTRQRGLVHLDYLAHLVCRRGDGPGERGRRIRELKTAMSQVPGLPAELRRSLAGE